MYVRVATFNLGNLYSRYDFGADRHPPSATPSTSASPSASVPGSGSVKVVTTLFPAEPEQGRVRTYRGALVRAKPARARSALAARIRALDADILAVQEVEDIDALNRFATVDLDGAGYQHRVLLEGNDRRLIEIGMLSRLPLGSVTSWRNAVAQRRDTIPVFSRDLLQVEILNPNRTRKLFTVFNTHLIGRRPDADPDGAEGAGADAARLRQAETAARIITEQTRPHQRFLICGDFNDVPDSPFLAPLLAGPLQLVDALAGRSAAEGITDQIWLSPPLALHRRDAGVAVDRRLRLTAPRAAAHDPTWVDLEFASGGRGRWRPPVSV
jgi:endonuclease/exonuclease/phosphatase family metal-dependent hydrolase